MKDPFATHLPALLEAVRRTRGLGPVLELGAGLSSTPALHGVCLEDGKRRLVTVDTARDWAERFRELACDFHEVLFLEPARLPEVITRGPWAVALVDHKPPGDRGNSVKLLAPVTRFVVVHDTEPDGPHYLEYGYEQAFRHYSYVTHWNRERPWTTVLSRAERFPEQP